MGFIFVALGHHFRFRDATAVLHIAFASGQQLTQQWNAVSVDPHDGVFALPGYGAFNDIQCYWTVKAFYAGYFGKQLLFFFGLSTRQTIYRRLEITEMSLNVAVCFEDCCMFELQVSFRGHQHQVTGRDCAALGRDE